MTLNATTTSLRKKRMATKKKTPMIKTGIPNPNPPEPAIATKEPTTPTISRYTLEPTDNPHLFRVVDESGDWVVYYNDQTKKYLYAVNYIIRHGFPKGEGFYNYLLSVSRDEAKKILEEAGERGARVHEAIRDLIDGVTIDRDRLYQSDLRGQYAKLTLDEWGCLIAFLNFCADYKPKVSRRESAVATGDYAGTMDFLGTIEIKGKTTQTLLDFKTSSAIYPDYKLQTAAYAFASGAPNTGILRLGSRHKRGYELVIWDHSQTREHYAAFRATLRNFRLENKPYEHKDERVPAILEVDIPIIKKETK